MRTAPNARRHFRRRELDVLLGILSARRPAVVDVSGEPGMGKSELLKELSLRASALGWAVAGGEDARRLAIAPSTSEREFRRTVLAASPPPPKEVHESGLHRTPPKHRIEPLVDELSRRAPLLALIDDYRPSPTFAHWFESRFLADVKASDAAVVVTVAQRPGGRPLQEVASDVVALGPLDPELVREELGELLPLLEPPADEAEISTYVSAAKSPLILDALIRTLTLARRPEIV
jgi:RecA/RadA recombinase